MQEKAKVIIADVKDILQYESKIIPRIAPQYVKKYCDHKIESDKKQELMAGYLLKHYLNVDSDEQLVTGENGKPELAVGEPYFNLSHSGKYVVLAIADYEIGIDIECVMPCHEATVKKVYSPKMQDELIGLEGEERNHKFTQLWTEFEARLKLKGTGFGEGWKEIQDMNCYINTRMVEDYFISVAMEEKMEISIQKFEISELR